MSRARPGAASGRLAARTGHAIVHPANRLGHELRTRDRHATDRQDRFRDPPPVRRRYGYCEVSGDPISLARLEARPVATMTLEAQERHERIKSLRGR